MDLHKWIWASIYICIFKIKKKKKFYQSYSNNTCLFSCMFPTMIGGDDFCIYSANSNSLQQHKLVDFCSCFLVEQIKLLKQKLETVCSYYYYYFFFKKIQNTQASFMKLGWKWLFYKNLDVHNSSYIQNNPIYL